MADVENGNDVTLDDLLHNDEYVPTRQELLELLKSDELDEETKDALRKMFAGDVPQVFGGHGGGTYMAIIFVMIIFSIILFFGYKLYKSIKDKEKKREEKKKQKEMKKKK